VERVSILYLSEQVTPAPVPDLSGEELLEAPGQAENCMVKGVMLVARQKFLLEHYGERELQGVLERLTPEVRKHAAPPMSASWVPFSVIVAYDRAILAQLGERRPDVLLALGAASAAYGIGTVYRVLDDAELDKFLSGIAHFHEQFQRYGRLKYTKTPRGAAMEYLDYPCYSPVFCASGVGFFLEAILRHGGREPHVVETKCHCRGDGVCRYEMTWR
jgi:hypothetical protein